MVLSLEGCFIIVVVVAAAVAVVIIIHGGRFASHRVTCGPAVAWIREITARGRSGRVESAEVEVFKENQVGL